MARGRKPLKDGYIINLEEIAFGIACSEQPSKGTTVDIVIPVYYNGDDFLERCVFLCNGVCYQSCIGGDAKPIEHSTMRRNFYIYDQFPKGELKMSYRSAQTNDNMGLTYYYKIRKDSNSAFRR